MAATDSAVNKPWAPGPRPMTTIRPATGCSTPEATAASTPSGGRTRRTAGGGGGRGGRRQLGRDRRHDSEDLAAGAGLLVERAEFGVHLHRRLGNQRVELLAGHPLADVGSDAGGERPDGPAGDLDEVVTV